MSEEPTRFDTKYLTFLLVGRRPKTEVWSVNNKHNGSRLGIIKWFAVWRQYSFFPETEGGLVFSAGCLRDIEEFITKLMNARRVQG